MICFLPVRTTWFPQSCCVGARYRWSGPPTPSPAGGMEMMKGKYISLYKGSLSLCLSPIIMADPGLVQAYIHSAPAVIHSNFSSFYKKKNSKKRMTTKLEGGGGIRALVVGPIRKYLFLQLLKYT